MANGKDGKKGKDGNCEINFGEGGIVIGGIIGDNNSDNSVNGNQNVEGQNNQVVGEIHIDGNTIGKGNVVRNVNGDSGEKADLKKRISATKKIIKEKEKELSQISAIHFIKRNELKKEIESQKRLLLDLEHQLDNVK